MNTFGKDSIMQITSLALTILIGLYLYKENTKLKTLIKTIETEITDLKKERKETFIPVQQVENFSIPEPESEENEDESEYETEEEVEVEEIETA